MITANEPRAYRESISEVLGELRPNLEVTSVRPETLEESVILHKPHVVICSEVTSVVRDMVPIWVELYPEHSSKSVVSIERQRTEVEDMQLSDLLSIVDRAQELTQSS